MAIDKNKLMGTLKKVGEQASQAVSDLRDNTKLSFSIAGKESELADLYRELGKATYEKSKGRGTGMAPDALMAVIDAKNTELEELKARKVELNALQTCPACGRDLADDAQFCPVCGNKLEQMGDRVKEAASEFAQAAKETAGDIKETASEVTGEIKSAFHEAKGTVSDAASEIRQTFFEAGENIKEHLDD